MGDELGSLDPVVVAAGFDQRDPAAADDFDLAALDQPALDGSDWPALDQPGLDGSELPDVATRSRSTSRPPARARAARARGGQRSLDPVVVAAGFDQRDPTAADDFDLAALDQPALDGSDWPALDQPGLDGSELPDVATRSRSTSRPPARARAARARGGQRSLDPVVVAAGFDQRDPTAADDFDLADALGSWA